MLSDAAATWPGRPAVVDEHGTLTFAELEDAVARVEAALRPVLGAREGLGVLAGNGRNFLIAMFAGAGVGATVLPISHQLKAAELEALLAEAPLHALVVDGSGPASAHGAPLPVDHGTLRLVRTGQPPGPFVPHVPDAAFVRFTSGTTGASKGVVVSHRAVFARTAAARDALGVTEHDTVLWVLPMAWHFIVSLVMYVRAGATLVVSPDILASTLLDEVARHRATLLYAAPMHYRLLAADDSGRDLSSLRLAVSTSQAIPRDVALAFHARYGLPISQVYGIIEIGLPAGNLDRGADHPDTIGRALPGHEVAILDDAGQPVPPGTIGHLAMRGPGMFDAYLSPPRLAADVLRDGWFMTGDLARLTDDGLIQVAGRRKSMINANGLKVFPEEVEAVIDTFPGVARSQVLAAPHPLMGEVVRARVLPVPGATLDPDALRRHCRARLSSYKVPQVVDLVDDLPQTASGKLRRDGA